MKRKLLLIKKTKVYLIQNIFREKDTNNLCVKLELHLNFMDLK